MKISEAGGSREAAIEVVAATLPRRAAWIIRQLIRATKGDLTLTMGGVLASVAASPRRITELAEMEGLAQPTVTVLVGRLEARGWVRREADLTDRRMVNVVITEAGRAALQTQRRAIHDVLAARLAALPADEIDALLAASHALERLAEALQAGDDS